MNSSFPPSARDGDITSDRRETKYLFPPERVDEFVKALRASLPFHRFTGERANSLPGAHHYITTIYFDTPSGRHYQAASGEEHSIKVRAREYYDVHPSLAEVATSSDDLLRYDPCLWFELKRRGAGHSEKRRFRLEKREVPGFFARGGPVSGSPGIVRTDAAPERDEIDAYLGELDEPLAATCLVNYRRVSWQAPDAALRVTLDLGLACYAPPGDLFTRDRPLERRLLGKPTLLLNEAVVEVKSRSAPPAWLAEAIERARVAPVEFSKFVLATRAVRAHA